MREKNRMRESGFTLLELMVVMAVIGLLASIAIPQFGSYRARAYDEHAQLSLRMVAVAEEAYFSEYTKYKTCNQSNCATLLKGVDKLNSGVVLQITSTTDGFSGTSSHQRGTGKVYHWPN